MHLRSITIEGIRSIDRVTIDFGPSDKAGWHVIVGPNGSGKSTVVRAIALAMLSERDVDASRIPLETWRRHGAGRNSVIVEVELADQQARTTSRRSGRRPTLSWTTHVRRDLTGTVACEKEAEVSPEELPWNRLDACFSAAFGSFRRLSGGDKERKPCCCAGHSLAHI